MKHTWWKYITKLVGGLNSCSVPACDIKPKWLMCIHMCGLLSNHHDLLLIVRFLVCSWISLPSILLVGLNVILLSNCPFKKPTTLSPWGSVGDHLGYSSEGAKDAGWTIEKARKDWDISPTIAIHEHPSMREKIRTNHGILGNNSVVAGYPRCTWLWMVKFVRVIPTRDGSG